MSQDIINKIKEAEAKARDNIAAAGVDADKIVSGAKAAAKESYDSGLKKAKSEAEAKLREAEEKAALYVADAEKKAGELKNSLKSEAQDKQSEAVKAVISSLLRK